MKCGKKIVTGHIWPILGQTLLLWQSGDFSTEAFRQYSYIFGNHSQRLRTVDEVQVSCNVLCKCTKQKEIRFGVVTIARFLRAPFFVHPPKRIFQVVLSIVCFSLGLLLLFLCRLGSPHRPVRAYILHRSHDTRDHVEKTKAKSAARGDIPGQQGPRTKPKTVKSKVRPEAHVIHLNCSSTSYVRRAKHTYCQSCCS